MTPAQLAKSNSEHGHQRALFAWANMAERYGFEAAWDERCYNVHNFAVSEYQTEFDSQTELPRIRSTFAPVPALAFLHAIANGGKRDKTTAAMLKAEGVKRGVPDVFLPWPLKSPGFGHLVFCGLYIEMKRPGTVKTGKRKATITDQAAGSTSTDQDVWHEYLRSAGYGVYVAYTWEDAAREIQAYIQWKV